MTRNVQDKICRVGALPERRLIRIQGGDAARLLQGQLSNDVMALAVAEQQYTSLNSPKGRLLATGYLFRADELTYLFDLPSVLAEPVTKRLKMFVLRSDVRIDVLADHQATAVLGQPDGHVDGLSAEALAALHEWDAPLGKGQPLSGNGFIVRRPGQIRRWMLWALPTDNALEDLSAAWRLADIHAGIPNLAPETQERFIAQHAGVDRLGGLSFTKGCFTGQEVIARLHYLGQAKRFLALGTSAQTPVPGQRLGRSADDSTVGEVIDAATHNNQSHWLAVIQGDTFAATDLHVASDQPVTSLQYFADSVVNDS